MEAMIFTDWGKGGNGTGRIRKQVESKPCSQNPPCSANKGRWKQGQEKKCCEYESEAKAAKREENRQMKHRHRVSIRSWPREKDRMKCEAKGLKKKLYIYIIYIYIKFRLPAKTN